MEERERRREREEEERIQKRREVKLCKLYDRHEGGTKAKKGEKRERVKEMMRMK